jgi:hypothetical protein
MTETTTAAATASQELATALAPYLAGNANGEQITEANLVKVVLAAGWVRGDLMVAVGDLADLTGMSKANVDRILRLAPLPPGVDERPQSWRIRHARLYYAPAALAFIEAYEKSGRAKPGRKVGTHRHPLAAAAVIRRDAEGHSGDASEAE